MKAPDIPVDELERLRELNEYSLLDTLPEEDYDSITHLASQICGTPVSMITLIDSKRQWFKSTYGINAKETPRQFSFCAHAINSPHEIMIVPDSREDERFADNPFVTGGPRTIFYAGVPLVTQKGHALGTLCVGDVKPHALTEEQQQALRILSKNVVKLFELRKSKLEMEQLQGELERKNKELERFASIAAHDLKSPLGNISSIIDLLKLDHENELSPGALELISLMDESSQQLRDLIDGILDYTRTDMLLLGKRELISLPQFFKEVASLMDPQHEYQLLFPTEPIAIQANKQALKQILINLISNGITYNDNAKSEIVIKLGFEETDKFYKFSVTDNGQGIAPQDQEKIFNLFERLSDYETNLTKGNGIGLSTVKKMVQKLGGEIELQSTMGKGTTISFSLLK